MIICIASFGSLTWMQIRTCRDPVLYRTRQWELPPQALLLNHRHNPRRELSRRLLVTPHSSLSRNKDSTRPTANGSTDLPLRFPQARQALVAFPAICLTALLLLAGSLHPATASLLAALANTLLRYLSALLVNHPSSAPALPVRPSLKRPPSSQVETRSLLAARQPRSLRMRPHHLFSPSLL